MNIQPLPQIPSLTIAGRTFTDLANLKVFTAYCDGAALGNNSARLMSPTNGTAGYQVTAGKTLTIYAVIGNIAVANPMYFGYSDNDVGIATNTAYTNLVYVGGTIKASKVLTIASAAAFAGFYEFPVNIVVPAAKYLAVSNQGGTTQGTFYLYGYEV